MAVKTGVIIVAGGSGSRMGSVIPKQFLKIGDKEILIRTVEKFRDALPECDMVVVLPENEIERWNTLASLYSIERCKVCCGGENRFLSVRNGLACIDKDCDLIAVQDGVRPLLSKKMIRETIEIAERFGSAIPVVEVTDTIRMITGNGADTIDRNLLRAVQTPQVFDATVLRKAYKRRYSKLFTDDASVVEKDGMILTFCQGEQANIKITTPIDLVMAEALVANDDGKNI